MLPIKTLKNYPENFIVGIILTFFFFIYASFVFITHYYFRSQALDYGFYSQVFWELAHFKKPESTVFLPHLNSFFQVHASFTLYVFIPLYWIFNWIFGSYTLLFIECLFLSIGGYGTYLFLKLKTGNFKLAIFGLIHYNIIWGHFSALSAEYIDATVAACIVPLFLFFFEKRNFLWASICFVFIIIAKENMPIWTIFICFFLITCHLKDRKMIRMAIIYILCSLAYLVFVFKLFLPYFEDPNLKYWGFAYSYFGNSFGEVLLYIIHNPWKSFLYLFENHTTNVSLDGIKAEFYSVFLFSGGVFLFLRPKYFLLFIPIIAQKMLNDGDLRWGINTFYSIEVVSILSLASIMCIDYTTDFRLKYHFAVLLCLFTLTTTIIKLYDRTSPGYLPYKENFLLSNFYSPTLDSKKTAEILKQIPEDASVSASSEIVPHLAYRSHIFLFPDTSDAKYIIILQGNNTYPLSYDELQGELNEYMQSPKWTVFADNYPLLIFKKLGLGEKKIQYKKEFIVLEEMSCDAEKLNEEKDRFLSTDGTVLFAGGNCQSDEFARSGKYSAKVNKDNEFCFAGYKITNAQPGDKYVAEVWRKGCESSALVVTTDNMELLCIISQETQSVDSLGWQQIRVPFTIPGKIGNHTISIYVWNSNKQNAFFDDFKISKIK